MNNSGFSIVGVIGIIMILSMIGVMAISMLGSTSAFGIDYMQSQSALYIADAGMRWYLEQLQNDNNWSNNTNESAKNFNNGTFTVTVANQQTNSIDVTSTSALTGYESQTVKRVVTATITRQATGNSFSDYSLFAFGGNGSYTSDIGDSENITGDIFIKGNVSIGKNSTITGSVIATGSIATGSKVTITGQTLPNAPQPAPSPTLDTSYYTGLIATANGQPSGNRTFDNYVLSGTEYVRGNVTIKHSLTGSGTIVATGTTSIEGNADIASNINVISGSTLTAKTNAIIGGNTLFYSNTGVTISSDIGAFGSAGAGAAVLTPGNISIGKNFTGYGFIYGNDVTISGASFNLTGNLLCNRLMSMGNTSTIVKNGTLVNYGNINGLNKNQPTSISTSLWHEVI